MSGVRVGGAWKVPAQTFVKVAGSWKTVASIHTRVGGAWKVSDFSGPPATPTLTHTALGEFTIGNYDAALTYVVTNGTRVGAVVTVPGADSVMTVTAAYAPGAPASPAKSGERKSYTTTPTDVFESYVHGLPPDGVSNYGGSAAPGTVWLYCTAPAGESLHQRGINRLINQPGYTDQYGEWFKIY